MKKLLPIVAGLAVLFCGGASGQTAGRPATERYVIQKISDYSTTNGSMNVAIQALASAVVAATNLQAAITAEAAARASGDLVAMTNWQARVNALTNGAALGETALQPAWAATGTVANAVNADNTAFAGMAAELLRPGTDGEALDAAAAHAATEHSVTEEGGFQAGTGAAADSGGAVGSFASAVAGGGAVGYGAGATEGGAVGYGANAASGGSVGTGARTSDGFAGGKDAYATSDGAFSGEGIDAIQLGPCKSTATVCSTPTARSRWSA